MSTIILGSKRKGSLNPPLGAVVVPIDRGSVLGNPFDMGQDEALRNAVIEAHRAWLKALLKHSNVDAVALAIGVAQQMGLKIAPAWKWPNRAEILAELRRIEELSQRQSVWIMCWCVPAACHGNACIEAIESGTVARALL